LYPWLRHVFVDGGYAGDKLKGALEGLGNWTTEIVKRSDAAKGFILLPRRWVVERPVAWLSRNRRLAEDVEATIEVIAHLGFAKAGGDDSTKRMVSRTEALLALAVLTTDWKAA
jgi:transposase